MPMRRMVLSDAVLPEQDHMQVSKRRKVLRTDEALVVRSDLDIVMSIRAFSAGPRL